jgi:CubicO group peptidase (beta-lactamase class C family)
LQQLDASEARFAADFAGFLQSSMARIPSIPSVSVAVARSDGPIYVAALGRADIEAGRAATADTRYYIASSTKSFVGLMMLLLEAKGRIDLDWTLAELAPDHRFAPELRAREISLRHLLNHTHGIAGGPIEDRLAFTGDHDPQTLWNLLPRLTPNSRAPLGTFNYSNLGYNVATLLIERRLGRRWQDLLKQEVLRPLRLRQTLAQRVEAARRRVPFAAPYFGLGPNGPERIGLVKTDRIMHSAGGMFSTAEDMAQWLSLQLAAEKGRPGLPLPTAVLTASHRPVAGLNDSFGPFGRSGYGYGWYSGMYRGAPQFHSFGGFSGARAHVSFMPSQDVGVSIITNDEGAGFMFVDIAAAYAYDWFIEGAEAAAARGNEAVEKLAREAERRPLAVAAERAKRATRPWRLTLPLAAYAGRYCNADHGTIVVTAEGERMRVRMGLMNAVAEPFTEPDSVRVELRPNNGIVVQFTTDGNSASALRAFDKRFDRCR